MFERKIDILCRAIAEHEGWFAPGEGGFKEGSRSYRHHNPGNLRSSPFQKSVKDGYAVFNNDTVGMLALQWDIIQKAKGNTVTKLNGESTLAQLIEVYAPKEDNNNPISYLLDIQKRTGFSATMRLAEFLAM